MAWTIRSPGAAQLLDADGRGILPFPSPGGLRIAVTFALLALLGGCDRPTKPYRGNGLAGEYVLVAIQDWPLPGSESSDPEIFASRIGLWSNHRYEQVERRGLEQEVTTTGVFFPRGDRIVLVPEDGRAQAYGIAEGRLEGNGRLYLDAAQEIPAVHRTTRYRLQSCSGSPPSLQAPCPGDVIKSRIWLGETGSFWLVDHRANGSWGRQSRAYTIADNVISLDRPANPDRRVGSYSTEALTFDGWVYVREE